MKTKSEVLRSLMNRKDKVLSVLHTPTAAMARVMEKSGCEVGFVGTGGVVGGYTGLADVGTLTMLECVRVSSWIANSVSYPIMMDGDTGHGGIMAIRRLIRECINHGISGIRIDDQPIESKRRTQSEGIEVVSLEQAVVRYKAAVDIRDELDPNFVIMAQCYARDAVNSNFDDTIHRMKIYQDECKVDWVQLESPHSIEEIKIARKELKGHFSFMKGKLENYLGHAEHLSLGVNLAWYPSFTHHILWAALSDFMDNFNHNDIGAWNSFIESRKNRPYHEPSIGVDGEGIDKLVSLEEKYSNR